MKILRGDPMRNLIFGALGIAVGVQTAFSAPRPFPVESPVRPFEAQYDWVAFYDYLDGVNGIFQGDSELLTKVHVAPNQIIPRMNPFTAEYELRSRRVFDQNGEVEKLVLDFVLESDLSQLALEEVKNSFPAARLYNANPRESTLSIREFDDIDVVTLQQEDILLQRGHGEPVRIEIAKKGLESLSCAYQIGREVRNEEMATGEEVSPLDPLTLMMGGVDYTYKVIADSPSGFTTDASPIYIDKKLHVRIRLSPDDETMAVTPFYNLLMEKVLEAQPICSLDPQKPIEAQVEVPGSREFAGLAERAISLGIVLFNIDFGNLVFRNSSN